MIVTDKKYFLEKKLVEKLDLMVKRLKGSDDNVLIIDGDEGCLSGDTQIQISRCKVSRRYTLEKLYKHFKQDQHLKKRFDLSLPSYVRSFNGKEIKLHKIKDVVYSGIKKVYKLTLENGLSIKVTTDHNIMTKDGWIELNKLYVGQEIMCDVLNPIAKNRKRIKLYDIQLPIGKNHPYLNKSKRIEVHRLIYEAKINNLEFTEYLDILLNEPEICKTLKFINPKLQEIHHKDGCHYNNSIDNLELLNANEHRIEHGTYSNFSQGIPKFSKVKSIEYIGEEKTYDIQCEEPYHNFVANGIVIHNSGKTNLATGCCYYVAQQTNRHYGIDNIFFDLEKVINFASETKEQIIHWDEAAFGGMATQWWTENQLKFIQLVMTARKKKHFLIICIPRFYKLNEYLIVDRSIGLIHTYARHNIQKGRFFYYNKQNKELLFDDWKRKHKRSYKKYKSFWGSFPEAMPKIFTPEEIQLYEDKKDEAILSVNTKKERTTRRDLKLLLFQYKISLLPKLLGITQTELAKKFGTRQDTISEWGRIPEEYPIIKERLANQ